MDADQRLGVETLPHPEARLRGHPFLASQKDVDGEVIRLHPDGPAEIQAVIRFMPERDVLVPADGPHEREDLVQPGPDADARSDPGREQHPGHPFGGKQHQRGVEFQISKHARLAPEPGAPRMYPGGIIDEDFVQVRVVEENVAGVRADEGGEESARKSLAKSPNQRRRKDDIADPIRADDEDAGMVRHVPRGY
jgi:hypothetical protein